MGKKEVLFAQTLEKVRKQAKEQGNCISEEQVREAFAELELENEQLQMVFDYLVKHKIGIGAPPDGDMISWVLGDIPKEDQEAIFNCIMNVLPCIELIVDGKIDQAMNTYN